jgi:hypothetical protein
MRSYSRWQGRLDVLGFVALVAWGSVVTKLIVGWRGHATDEDAVEFGIWFMVALMSSVAYVVCRLCARRHRPSPAPPNP